MSLLEAVTKVNHLPVALLRTPHHVGRLEVGVHPAASVHVVQAFENVSEQLLDQVERETHLAVLDDQLLDVAVEELEEEERVPSVTETAVD